MALSLSSPGITDRPAEVFMLASRSSPPPTAGSSRRYFLPFIWPPIFMWSLIVFMCSFIIFICSGDI